MTERDHQARRWINEYTGTEATVGGSWWPSDIDTDRVLREMMTLAEELCGTATPLAVRQCAIEAADDWCRIAADGDADAVRAMTFLAVSLATGPSFFAALGHLPQLRDRPGMAPIVVMATLLAQCHVVERWQHYSCPHDEDLVDRTSERWQLVDLACRLAERGPLTFELLTLFAKRFRGNAADFALHILDICSQVPAGFADRLAVTLTQDWDGDPRDIPAAVEALMASPVAAA